MNDLQMALRSKICGAAIAMAVSISTSQWTTAQEWDFSGVVGAELRGFFESPASEDQLEHAQFSIFTEPEWTWIDESGSNRIGVTLFGRLDSADTNRSHFDVREMFWRGVHGDWEALVGVNRVFWGVTESRHLVNIINQIDFVENVDEEDFLGQPMVQLSLQKDYGRFSAFVLPRFRERTFPSGDGRPRFPASFDLDNPEFESDLGRWHPDVALRYSHFIGPFDVGVHVFRGTHREPRFVEKEPMSGAFTPTYDRMDQVGVDLQYTKDAWLWKLEGLFRHTRRDDYTALVSGVEYTFFQTFGSNSDVGLLVEYLFDDRNPNVGFPTAFENDLFLGTRWTLNDIQDTSALAGLVVDLDDQTTSIRLETERRFGSNWRVELEAQIFANVDDQNLFNAFRNDSFVNLAVSRFF